MGMLINSALPPLWAPEARPLVYGLVTVVAYLLGSIPFGYILVRIFRGEDVRQIGSGNIGATNVARKAPGLGIATLLLDAGKGFAAVWAADLLCSLGERDDRFLV